MLDVVRKGFRTLLDEFWNNSGRILSLEGFQHGFRRVPKIRVLYCTKNVRK